MVPSEPAPPASTLLAWYDRHRRSMPWRALPGESADPYRVWLSEVMLQQTTVAAVIPYFRRFLERFPTVAALAAAPDGDVMEAWAGLGYYARARNLHACAKAVAAAGAFPRDMAGLRALPGIGAYTAAAMASIAFGVPAVPVDGNVERVAARVFAIEAPLPRARPAIAAAAARLGDDPAARARPADFTQALFAIETPLPGARPVLAAAAAALGRDPLAIARPSDFTQALFDLGATVCTPRSPACALCPWRGPCAAQAAGTQDGLPAKAPRPVRPVRHGALFWLEDGREVLLRRRPPDGLLGGMLELPGTEWRSAPWTRTEALAEAPQEAAWQDAGAVTHGFTHFELRLDVYAARVPRLEAAGLPHLVAALETAALPTAMRRGVARARAAGFGGASSPCLNEGAA